MDKLLHFLHPKYRDVPIVILGGWSVVEVLKKEVIVTRNSVEQYRLKKRPKILESLLKDYGFSLLKIKTEHGWAVIAPPKMVAKLASKWSQR